MSQDDLTANENDGFSPTNAPPRRLATKEKVQSKDFEQAIHTTDQDVEGLQSFLHFYKLLKIRSSVGEDEESQANYMFHKKYLSKIKIFFLVLYIGVNPIIDSPKWCIDHYQ